MTTAAPDLMFKTLGDPTRRAIFERLCRDGELTVWKITGPAGVSQPAVSKHLGTLKLAGLVKDRREGRETHYSAQPQALSLLTDWVSQMAAFWESRIDSLEANVRRAIDIHEGEKINEKALKTLFRAAVALNTSKAKS